ncbi:MAG: cytidylyltransferase domain-containing protein [Anaerolineales bacterium]
MRPKTVAIIQARMASSRLPDKVLLEIGDQPMLVWVVERARLAMTVDEVVVATTTDASDDAIQALCQKRGYAFYRGSAFDVLDRYYQASRRHPAEVIVRITADCPLIDPALIDQAVTSFIGANENASVAANQDSRPLTPNSQLITPNSPFAYDFVANRLPPPWGRTYPVGLDIEVCAFAGLEQAWKEASLPHQREHVMPFFYEQPERFRIHLLNNEIDYGHLRWTVDTPQDLELLRTIADHFGGRKDFSWLEVLEFVQGNPQLVQINAQVRPKDYRAIDERNRTET